MSDARSMSLVTRAEAYQRQTGRRTPTSRQRRRLDHKSRKRFGFASWAWYFTSEQMPVLRGGLLDTPEERFRQRQIFAGPLIDPKSIVMITGTGE